MCCSGLLKLIMFFFNGAICLVGAALLGVGIWVKVDSGSLLGFLDHIKDAPPELAQLANVGYILIGLGVLLTLIGFLGCCGAVKESPCMLLTFFIIVLIIFIVEVAGAIVLFVFQPLVKDLLSNIGSSVAETIKTGYGKEDGLTTFWDTTMTKLKCCGYNNYTDFEGSPYVTNNKKFPQECCNQDMTCTAINAANQRVKGCFLTLVELIEDNALIVAGVAIGICFVEIAAMVVSMVLYKKASKQDH